MRRDIYTLYACYDLYEDPTGRPVSITITHYPSGIARWCRLILERTGFVWPRERETPLDLGQAVFRYAESHDGADVGFLDALWAVSEPRPAGEPTSPALEDWATRVAHARIWLEAALVRKNAHADGTGQVHPHT